MKYIKEKLKNLKDGQVLQVYFDSMGKEGNDGRKERTGVHPRGIEERYVDEPGENGAVSG